MDPLCVVVVTELFRNQIAPTLAVDDRLQNAALERLLCTLGERATAMAPHREAAGALDMPAVAEWIAAGDILTLASWNDGRPKVMDGFGCGRLAVATSAARIREALVEAVEARRRR